MADKDDGRRRLRVLDDLKAEGVCCGSDIGPEGGPVHTPVVLYRECTYRLRLLQVMDKRVGERPVRITQAEYHIARLNQGIRGGRWEEQWDTVRAIDGARCSGSRTRIMPHDHVRPPCTQRLRRARGVLGAGPVAHVPQFDGLASLIDRLERHLDRMEERLPVDAVAT
jgi:hypothetical protein